MGAFTFTWEHPAEEVYVTGTFDNWTKSVKLEKNGDLFSKSVTLPDASSKIYYKFVVDNNWTTNETAPKEADHEGNVNNFLTPEQIIKTDPAAAVISTVGPDATTAKMAGEVPKEVPTPADVPGGFPATPADELDKPVGINPLPAADGAVNPVKLEPGEKVPEATTQDINQHVKLDKDSYEKSDTLAGVQTTLPAATTATIPESSLPITGGTATINSVGPDSTTAALAGNVPLEPKVPAVVKDSQEKAHADPEASAVAEEVREKAEVEDELKHKVPEAPSTSEGTAGVGTEKAEGTGAATAAAATTGGAIAGAALAAKDSIVNTAAPVVNQASTTATDAANKNLPDSVKEKLPVSAQQALAAQNQETKREEVSPEVPPEVKESITEAGESPEAAANTSAVEDKKAVESELLKEVKPVPAAGEAKSEVKPESKAETAPAEVPATSTPAAPAAPTNGSESKPSTSDTPANKTTDASAAERKKKNRLSSMLSKIKHKITDKN